ncbi:hypothetical protein ABZ379_22805 [Streptomyces canus]|uniref:hypothetical protein n=1 Tax=Streptomyces canus TaxID=58343 RepID=UPI0033F6E7B3
MAQARMSCAKIALVRETLGSGPMSHISRPVNIITGIARRPTGAPNGPGPSSWLLRHGVRPFRHM